MSTLPRDRLLGELIALREYAGLRRDPVYAGGDAPGADGRPVLLIPAFLTPDRAMAVMSRWLRRSACRRFRTELHGPFPKGVGFVAVFSKRDGIVDWRRLTERAATMVEVGASHLGSS